MSAPKSSFNRTSMESKRVILVGLIVRGSETFNRTSMESKRASCGIRYRLYELLIEPVWNRNPDVNDAFDLCDTLLIEPVWNRNFSWCFRIGGNYRDF